MLAVADAMASDAGLAGVFLAVYQHGEERLPGRWTVMGKETRTAESARWWIGWWARAGAALSQREGPGATTVVYLPRYHPPRQYLRRKSGSRGPSGGGDLSCQWHS